MVGVLAPLDHKYVKPLPVGALSVTCPPAQKVVGPEAVTTACGTGLNATTTGAELAVQLPFEV